MLPPEQPTEIDSFGFDSYVRGIENLVRGATNDDLPLTVGIYGHWGAGKSSFMMQLKHRLEAGEEGFPNLPCIWFDAWKYDRIVDTRSALIYRILLDMKQNGDANVVATVGEVFDKCSKVFQAFAVQSQFTIGIPGVGVNLPSVKDIGNQLVDEVESFQTEVDEFSEIFGEVVEKFIEYSGQTDGGKLIVFIDDLDRCLPENVISSLEALKLFLNETKCVFILGLDRSIVENAIQHHYKITPDNMGRDYLDKIIRVPFVIPQINPYTLRTHFTKMLGDFDDACWAIIEVATHGNPRLYSRFIGTWKVVAALADVGLDLSSNQLKRMLVIALAVLLRFPRLHELGMSFPDEFKFFYQRCRANESWVAGAYGNIGDSSEIFREFYDDVSTRGFFRGLRARLGENMDTNPLEGPANVIATAFRLTASTS